MARPGIDTLRLARRVTHAAVVLCTGLSFSIAEAQAQTRFGESACTVGADRDGDGLSDQCELELATTFAPELWVSDQACNWDGSRLEGGYLFGAAWNGAEGGVRIVYLPAYRLDCGWSGVKCWIRLAGGCRGHAGDSEFLAVDARPGSDGWTVEAVFMSAHCFGDDACRWYRGQDLERMEWAADPFASGPVVWVAEGKNANYPSKSACDRAHYYYDTCDRNRVHYTFPVEDIRNVGSGARPVGGDGCATWSVLEGDGSPDRAGTPISESDENEAATECFWSDIPFRGWLGTSEEGVTPYVSYLREVAGWT